MFIAPDRDLAASFLAKIREEKWGKECVSLFALKPEGGQAAFRFYRLFHPQTTTTIATEGGEGGGWAVGYFYVQASEDLYRWFWVSKEYIFQTLDLITYAQQNNLLEPVAI